MFILSFRAEEELPLSRKTNMKIEHLTLKDRETEIANLIPLKLEPENAVQNQNKISPGEYAALTDVDSVSSLSQVTIPKQDDWHIPPTDVHLMEMIGKGRFGKVYRALVQVKAIEKCNDVIKRMINVEKEKEVEAAVKLNGIH